MRTRNEIERLAAAGRPLLSRADTLVDAAEEERILEGILASERAAGANVPRRRHRAGLALAGVAVLAAAVAVASIEIGHGTAPVTRTTGHHKLALTGPRIELAGYTFKSPAGFKLSDTACGGAPSGSSRAPGHNGFSAAASAAGGCLEAGYVAGGVWGPPADAAPVDVGKYQGYFVSPDASGMSTLYIELPFVMADGRRTYLVLFATGLTKEQLSAVAQSGLPANPVTRTLPVCTANCG